MKRYLDFVLLPFVVFIGLIGLWVGIVLLLGSAAFIARILRAFIGWLSNTLPQLLATTFSDPWKVASLPIAVGLLIVVGWWIWEDAQSNSQTHVLRGRELRSRRGQPASGGPRVPARFAGWPQPAKRARWTPSSSKRS